MKNENKAKATTSKAPADKTAPATDNNAAPVNPFNNPAPEQTNVQATQTTQPAQPVQQPVQNAQPVQPVYAQPVYMAMPMQPGAQPVNGVAQPVQQPVMMPAGQPMQQPMMMPVAQANPADEYKGLKGWLAFFMVIFGLNGLGYIIMFFAALAGLLDSSVSAGTIALAVISPIAGAAMIMAATNIAMRKKLGKLMSQLAIIISTVGMVVLNMIAILAPETTSSSSYNYEYSYKYGDYDYSYSSSSSDDSAEIVLLVGTTVVQLVVCGLYCLYFQKSKRVQATLVE